MTNDYNRFNSWKGLAYLNKLEECSAGKFPSPVNWHVYISNSCPYQCNFCIMKNRIEGAKLPKKTLEKLANDARRLEVKLVHISGGGEPLTHPDINSFISHLKEKKIKVAISTNGYFLNRLDEQVDHLRVSFNAGRKSSYERIHGREDSFERVKLNIKEAVKFRKGKDIGMGYVLTHENWREIDNFVQIAEEVGVDFVHIRPAFWPENNQQIIQATKDISPCSIITSTLFT